ncbi:MAG: alternative ribosome rescue aminoacyl-tRNA hydrolase ArfB [Bacteroidales bacterium]
MAQQNIRNRDFEKEFQFNTARSGGPGGQHANKTETQVELRFSIPESQILNEEEKQRMLKKLSSKVTKEGELIVTAESKRSQLQNKEEAMEKFYSMVEKALKKPKKRKPTKPTRAAKKKRLEEKKKHSEKKAKRKPPEIK